MPDISDLRQRQALPLRAKVLMSQNRIREWYDHWNGDVYISFSGGKDSTVLAHLVHDLYPEVPMVFSNTGLEYPEIQAFARKMGAEFIRPKMSFSEVISKYGYPIISKENAEAIYYARKIRNAEGGGTTTVHHRNEINGLRCDTQSLNGQNCSGNLYGGGVRDHQTESRHHRNTRAYIKAGRAGEGQRSPENRWGGYIPQTTRMRTQLRGEYGGIRAGVEPTGGNGEGTPSPG